MVREREKKGPRVPQSGCRGQWRFTEQKYNHEDSERMAGTLAAATRTGVETAGVLS